MYNFARSFAFSNDVLRPLEQLPHGDEAARAAGLSRQQASVRYPARLLRYLLPYAWMEELRSTLGRPLRVCEIGTGSGQMKRFIDFMSQEPAKAAESAFYESWQGFDIAPQVEALKRAGYGEVEAFNADEPLQREFRGFDVVLLLHVLEHLREPEDFSRRLAGALDAQTLLIGGVPSVPGLLAGMREARLRQKYKPGGHWCKFSAGRVRRLAQGAGLVDVFLTGAFLLRASGSSLENNLHWMRWNLALAHYFPWWPGEVYFRARVAPGPMPIKK